MTSELFRFARGAEVWGFSGMSEPVDFGGLVYNPTPIKRAQIEQTQEVERADLSVEVARDNPVALLFQAGAPVTPVTLTIYRGDALTAGYVGLWTGFVQSANFTGSTATLTCAPAMSALRRNAPRQRYSQGCRFALFDSGCGVVKATYADTINAFSFTDRELVVRDVVTARAAGYFVGGFVEFPVGRELIVTSDASSGIGSLRQVRLELARAIPGLVVGAVGIIYPGCNHQLSHCASKFSNAARYGGFATLPSRLEE
jgi:uncharacterized phage protein (TIGR02218 family)